MGITGEVDGYIVWLVEHNSFRHIVFSMLIHAHLIISIHVHRQ